jgi:hypothetical protein
MLHSAHLAPKVLIGNGLALEKTHHIGFLRRKRRLSCGYNGGMIKQLLNY